MLKVNEIFKSIQGETSFSGLACVFIRLAECNLRCSYCDTKYAYDNYSHRSIKDILDKVDAYKCRLVSITGGEPLLQNGVNGLIDSLIEAGYEVLIETNGSLPIKDINKKAKVILDIKCPSSQMDKNFLIENLDYIKSIDEIKLVISDVNDYNWAKQIIVKYDLLSRCNVLMSPVFEKLEPNMLSQWVLDDGLNVRVQMQLHKLLGMK